jgi:hypothetical protein
MSRTRKSNLLGKTVVLVAIWFCALSAQAKYDWATNTGNGSPDNPYHVSEPNHLIAIGSDPNLLDKCFVLMDDIEFDTNDSKHVFETAIIAPDACNGMLGHNGSKFDGVFDGSGHCIKNLRIDASSTGNDFLGLIGRTGPNSVVQDLGLVNVQITGRTSRNYTEWVGALAGTNTGRMENCFSIGDVTASLGVGGLVGNNHGQIINCYSIYHIVAASFGGGLTGNNAYSGQITMCFSRGTAEGGEGVGAFGGLGGLVGRNMGIVELCYSSSHVSTKYGTDDMGGLVGKNYRGTISNCYAMGEVDKYGSSHTGGLVGYNEKGRVQYCYSTAKTSVGNTYYRSGLVGRGDRGVVFSYWDIETSQTERSDGGIGLTTAEMMSRETYIFWEQEEAWVLDDGNDYPHLVWEGTVGTPIAPVSGAYGGGEGTAENPFLIKKRENLLELHIHPADWDKHFRMTNDIDLSPELPGGVVFHKALISYNTAPNYWNGFVGIAFSGSFDGGGYTISNFMIDPGARSVPNLGLFGETTTSSVIKNLVLHSVSIAGYASNEYVGAIAGQNRATLSNCHVTGSILGHDYTGGLAGMNSGAVYDCSFSGDLEGRDSVGGLTGENEGEIVNCTCDVNLQGSDEVGGMVGLNHEEDLTACFTLGTIWGQDNVGGLVGYNEEGTISQCYSDCNIEGWDNVGGLIGRNRMGTISQCYSDCDIDGRENVGGLAGIHGKWYFIKIGGGYVVRFDGRDIENSYAEGIMTETGHSVIGGLVGQLYAGTIKNCFSTFFIQGIEDLGGVLGANVKGSVSSCYYLDTAGVNNGFGSPLTMEDMRVSVSYVDWDFNTPVWTIDEGVDYPRLWWEYVPMLYAEPEITLGTSNTISWDPVVGVIEYYAECAEDANFTSIIKNSGWITETSCEFVGLELGKRYFYSVKARNAAGTESGWSNVESSLQLTLADVVEILLEPESLKNENVKNALLNKIDEALQMIDEGLYRNALNKLENDILQKTNGCGEMGRPDKNDWIITCEQQSQIYPLIIETIEHVKGLME